ncbi:MAG: dNTP triphosphohydrolase [Prevotellaceae bacterium]|nr:dNTP triphosphohydrolase [Prevotellaceae bacterium]
MHWQQLISAKRYGMEGVPTGHSENRSEFQRDFDRLIFSAPFRRLQNKTQVFPLPGSVFVHNRLTHSLEVSCVGRSLAGDSAAILLGRHPELRDTFFPEIAAIVQAACLAHDLGNPPFGHSGERAISTYFSEGRGRELESRLTAEEWTDFIRFEGNANAFRLLTHQFDGRRRGGFAMTYSTLAAIVKYPFSSSLSGEKGKFGFFVTEADTFRTIADELHIECISGSPLHYVRHPLVYLVEAADDICYEVMDIEDAHKLKILTTSETIDLLMAYFDETRSRHLHSTLRMVSDVNEQVAYLRSSVIGLLVRECTEVFVDHEADILAGRFSGSLIEHVSPRVREAYRRSSERSVSDIYRSRDVLDVELAGFRVIKTLLELMVDAVQTPDSAYSRLLINRVSSQYHIHAESLYGRVQAVLDYISGMTDVFALDLYRKINGHSLPAV